MVLTRETREEIELAVSKAIKNDLLISQIAKKVTEAIIQTMENKLLNIETSVAELKEDYGKMNTKIEDKTKYLQNKINILSGERDEMESKIDQMDQATRSSNLRVFSMKETSKEDTRKVLIETLNKNMSLNLIESDILLCYRIGKSEQKKSRGVFLKLKDLETKKMIYSKKKLLKGTGIVIREDLTSLRVNLLNEAIRIQGLKNVWTEHGKIYVNKDSKVYIIRNRNDFNTVFTAE